VRNKTAFDAFAQDLQSRLLSGETEFALLVADLNDLKKINDSYGHDCGDEYIKRSCHIICRVFAHSPVFRVGGDEFAVISQGSDFEHIEELVESVNRHNAEALRAGGVVVACGMSRFDQDQRVTQVFARADRQMYENKTMLKRWSKGE
jgi:diguanylate cyclase (GGDEF)-like protein